MTTTQLLEERSSRGITLEPQGDQIRVTSPPGSLTPTLRQELVDRKPDVLRILLRDPLVPAGWTPEAWHGRLLHLARICMHADRAEELQEWAAAVALRYGLAGEGS